MKQKKKQPATVYGWKGNVSIPVDAQLAGETVEMLREKLGGTVAAGDLLMHARESNSPLHAAFEWDDSAAAEQYRLQQAGYILRSLTVTVRIREEKPSTPVRAFVNVVHEERRGYTSLAHAMSESALRDQVLARAWKELLAWKERYKEYEELAAVIAAIDSNEPAIEPGRE